MPLKNITNKKEVYYMALMISNFIIVLSTIFLSIALITPLFGGKLLVLTIIKYASWLALAVVLKIVVIKLQKEMLIGKKEYLLIYLATTVNIIFWISYPFNIIFSILAAIVLIYSYKRRTELEEGNDIQK